MTPQFDEITSSSKLFDVLLFLLSGSVNSASFNIITGSGVMKIFVCKGFTKNPEIWNTPVAVYLISGDYSKLGIPNLKQMFLIKMVLNAAKLHGYNFYRFWVIKINPSEGIKLASTQYHCSILKRKLALL